jgi:ribosome-binding protein aMBF1 (putative translation factor)
MECVRCGTSGDRVKLYDAISKEGIVKICESCSSKEDIPIIQRPTNFQLQESERKQTIHERLSSMAGLQEDKSQKKISRKQTLPTQQEVTLRSLVDKNFKLKVEEKIESNNNLIHNFHWILMRARRFKHITKKQLAGAIFEPEAAIKMAEKGVLPKDSHDLIKKLENYLGIKLLKQSNVGEVNLGESKKVVSFNSEDTRTLTISDLRELNKSNEEEIFGGIEEGISEKIEDMEIIPEYKDYEMEVEDEDDF